MKRPADAYWFNLKDRVRRRCNGKCEYCQLRPGRDLHHRTYAREGAERLEDVMIVCDSCHEIIHGLKSCGLFRDGRDAYNVKVGSLADLGDRGIGTSCFWEQYLEALAPGSGDHHHHSWCRVSVSRETAEA